MEKYIKNQKKILKDFCIWDKMLLKERKEFMKCKTEVEVERLKRTMMSKYF